MSVTVPIDRTFTDCVARAFAAQEMKGLSPIRVEMSPIMRDFLKELYPGELLTFLYGVPFRVNPQLQGIALIVRTEEDA